MIDALATKVDAALSLQSGKVFYSGRAAFAKKSDIYILGYNPEGDPDSGAESTIGAHTDFVLRETPEAWSAYTDESWKGRPAGMHGMQPRVRHLLSRLRRDPRRTPSSNLLFVRSPRANQLMDDSRRLEEVCWPFHAEVLRLIQPKIIICFGKKVGDRVRRRIGADRFLDEFIEDNERKWTSSAYQDSSGLLVLSLTHPSIADWTAPPTDPSSFVQKYI